MLRADGARFVEYTLDGHARELTFEGSPVTLGLRYAASSPSGRYITWIAGGSAWIADRATMKASRITYDPPRIETSAVGADDLGRVTFSSRYRSGQLFEVRGSFP
jgi:hypothetical protein